LLQLLSFAHQLKNRIVLKQIDTQIFKAFVNGGVEAMRILFNCC